MSRLNRREFMLGASAFAAGVAAAVAPQEHYTLMMLYDPRTGQTAAFDAWWPAHRRAVGAIPGVVSAEAYQRSDVQVRAGAVLPLPAHAALYTIVSKDVAAVVSDLGKRLNDGRLDLAPVDTTSARTFAYQRIHEWSSRSQISIGNSFLQMVFANPVPGREREFADWYDETHSRELLKVPGIVEIERSIKLDACPTECSDSPKSLSALRIRAPSIEQFKVGLEKVAKSFTDTTSYDIANAWRLTLHKVG